jgi:hypothetical protein
MWQVSVAVTPCTYSQLVSGSNPELGDVNFHGLPQCLHTNSVYLKKSMTGSFIILCYLTHITMFLLQKKTQGL